MSPGFDVPSLGYPWLLFSSPNNAIFGSHYRCEVMGPFHNSSWLCALSTNRVRACRSRTLINNCSWQAPAGHLFDLHSRVDTLIYLFGPHETCVQYISHIISMSGPIFGSGHSMPMTRALHLPHFPPSGNLDTGTMKQCQQRSRPMISYKSLFVSSISPDVSVVTYRESKLEMHLQMKPEAAALMYHITRLLSRYAVWVKCFCVPGDQSRNSARSSSMVAELSWCETWSGLRSRAIHELTRESFLSYICLLHVRPRQ